MSRQVRPKKVVLLLFVPEQRAVVCAVVCVHGVQGRASVAATADGGHLEVQVLKHLGHLLLEGFEVPLPLQESELAHDVDWRGPAGPGAARAVDALELGEARPGRPGSDVVLLDPLLQLGVVQLLLLRGLLDELLGESLRLLKQLGRDGLQGEARLERMGGCHRRRARAASRRQVEEDRGGSPGPLRLSRA